MFMNYELNTTLINYQYFIDLLKSNKSFLFTRIQHGEWDSLIDTHSDFSQLLQNVKENNWKTLADTVKSSLAYKYWNNPNESALEKIALMYKVIYENNNIIPNLHLGITADAGLGNSFSGSFGINSPYHKKRIKLVNEFTKNCKNIYNGGLPRHMGVMGEFYDFFNQINEMEIDVIIIGADYLSVVSEEFNITKFHHIKIPYKFAINSIDTQVNQLMDLVSKLKNPLIIGVASHPISAFISYTLRNTNASFFDVGRGIDWNLKKYMNKYPQMEGAWLKSANEQSLKKYIKKLRSE